MTGLVRAGHIRTWGTSCWRAEQLERAHAIAGREGLIAPMVEQPQYSLLERGIERDALPTLRRLQMGIVVFSPLAGGVLTGKHTRGGAIRAAGARARFLAQHLRPRHMARVRRFVEIAHHAGIQPATLALAWVVRQPAIAAAITGATSVAQVEANLEAARCEISRDLALALDQVFPVIDRPWYSRWLGRLG
jgi:aryl-alcohol dehydrogenase-like predicted oxidoreductase